MPATGGATVGGISVTISANVQRFQKGLNAARKMLKRFGAGVKNTIFSLKGLAAAAAGGIFVKLVKDQFSAIDSLAKTADKLGVTTSALAGLRLAADESGAGAAALDKGLTNLTKSVGEAAQGFGAGIRAFKMLGLDARELNQLSPDKQFIAIAEAMQKMGSSQDQLTVATELFGARGSMLINTLRLGKGGLEEAQVAAENLGIAISRESARGVERAIDAFGRLKAAVAGIFRSIAVEIAPFVEVLSAKMTSFMAEGGRAKNLGKSIGDFIVKAISMMADAGQRAFAGLLRAAAAVLDAVNKFRGSTIGASMGLDVAPRSAYARVFALRQQAFDMERARNLPSTKIAAAMSAARAATAGQQAAATAGSLGGALKGIGGKLFGGAGTTAQQLLGTLAGGAAKHGPTPLSIFGGIRGAANALFNVGAGGAGGGVQNALAFAQTGSAQSYRQRADARRLNKQDQHNKKQLTLLEQIADNTKKKPGAALEAANL